ncbi:MAG: RimK/LysX family protein [Hyphomicrobium sp.]
MGTGNREPHVTPRLRHRAEKSILGWREWVTFPDFGDVRVKAKVDTGARTSALHALNINVVQKNGQSLVSFELRPEQRDDGTAVQCVAPLIARRSVKSSNGQTEERLFVSASICIEGRCWPIELSLTRRDEMGFRMLLGRNAVRGKYLVDPGRSFVLGK